jgi:hypothetical protein
MASPVASFSRNVWLRTGGPSAPKAVGAKYPLDLQMLGHAAARETLTTASTDFSALWVGLFQHMITSAPDFTWRGDGPGIGRDAKTAYSGLMGRFIARAFLRDDEGVSILVPLDTAKRFLIGSRFEIQKAPAGDGYEADWIGLDRDGVVIVEAKSTYNGPDSRWCHDGAFPDLVRVAARGQADRTRLVERVGGADLPVRRWAVGTRWGTETNGLKTAIVAWDPVDGELDPNSHRELAKLLTDADLQGVMRGIRGEGQVGPETPTTDGPEPFPEAVRVRIGDVLLEPGDVAAIGPLGVTPIQGKEDLEKVEANMRDGAPTALVSLSASYVEKSREDPMLAREVSRGEGYITAEGLTVVWPMLLNSSPELEILG